MRRLIAPLLFTLALIGSAAAQTAFPTPDGRNAAIGTVPMCLNGSSQAIPCSSVTPLPITPPTANVDSTGATRVNTEGGKASYRSTFAASAIDATGVICQVTGSATKIVKITLVRVTGKLTTGASGEIVLTGNSTAASGGTPIALTLVPLDRTNAAATAGLTAYTAVPTAGTSIGNVAGKEVFWPASTASGTEAFFDFGNRNTQALTLRGTSQFLTVRTLGFASYAGAVYTLEIEWTEE